MTENEKLNTSICLENRKKLSLTGVTDVDTFNEDEVRAKTDYGDLLIKGSGLHIESLDLQTGDLQVTGEIVALVYSDRIQPKSIFKRAFS